MLLHHAKSDIYTFKPNQDCSAQCDHSFLSLTFVYVSKEVGLVCPSFVNLIGFWPTFSNRIWWGGENMLYGFIN